MSPAQHPVLQLSCPVCQRPLGPAETVSGPLVCGGGHRRDPGASVDAAPEIPFAGLMLGSERCWLVAMYIYSRIRRATVRFFQEETSERG